jgi:hypothetical protein
MLFLLAPLSAHAQHHAGQPPPTFVGKENQNAEEHHRKNAVIDYGSKGKEPERPFPWRALGLGLLAVLAAAPFAAITYRRANKDLTDMKTVGRDTAEKEKAPREREAKKPSASKGAKPSEGGNEPRDRVWEAMQSVSQWVPVDWVAREAGLSEDDAQEELVNLVGDGYLEQSKDKQQQPIFRNRAA